MAAETYNNTNKCHERVSPCVAAGADIASCLCLQPAEGNGGHILHGAQRTNQMGMADTLHGCDAVQCDRLRGMADTYCTGCNAQLKGEWRAYYELRVAHAREWRTHYELL